jgi:hypothetical protein
MNYDIEETDEAVAGHEIAKTVADLLVYVLVKGR